VESPFCEGGSQKQEGPSTTGEFTQQKGTNAIQHERHVKHQTYFETKKGKGRGLKAGQDAAANTVDHDPKSQAYAWKMGRIKRIVHHTRADDSLRIRGDHANWRNTLTGQIVRLRRHVARQPEEVSQGRPHESELRESKKE